MLSTGCYLQYGLLFGKSSHSIEKNVRAPNLETTGDVILVDIKGGTIELALLVWNTSMLLRERAAAMKTASQ